MEHNHHHHDEHHDHHIINKELESILHELEGIPSYYKENGSRENYVHVIEKDRVINIINSHMKHKPKDERQYYEDYGENGDNCL